MSEKLESTTLSQSMLFAVDSLARMSASRVKERDLMERDRPFGVSFSESFAKLNQSGFWQKMSGGYFQVTMDNSLETFSGIWPQSGMMRSGTVYQRPSLEHHNYAIGFTLLPTPRAILGEALDFLTFSLRTNQTWKNTGDLPARVYGMVYKLTGREKPLILNVFLNPCFCEWVMGFPENWTKKRRHKE